MVADAVHSISDFATDCVVLFFVRISAKPKDKDHAYGHGKYETVASIIIALALGAVGVGICVGSAQEIAAIIRGEAVAHPEFIALIAAVLSIVVKEWLYRYTAKVGKATDSPAVIANAWHHRSDALSSIGALIGIGCAYVLGGKWSIADPIAAIVVAAMILKVAIDLLRKGFYELVDGALPSEVEEEIIRIITEDAAISHPHNLRTRRIGATIAIEVHIRVDGDMSVRESHSLTESIERRLRERFGEETMIAIHVEPINII
jgi:cation diffusion facilitator family transporter